MRTLRKGDRGSIVELLQWGLRRFGCRLELDGIFGQATDGSVRAFQQSLGLAADGVAGQGTWAALHPWLIGRYSRSIVPAYIRWSSDLLTLVVEGLRERYPFLRANSISQSVLGRPIWQLSIGQGSARVGYNAAHHANEWITTPLLLQFLEHYAAALSSGTLLGGVDCRKLYDNYTLDIVPMVNPDGVDLVTNALDQSSEVYKEAEKIAAQFPQIPFPNN